MPGHLTPHAELLLAMVTGSAHIFAAWRNPVIDNMLFAYWKEEALSLHMIWRCVSRVSG